MTAGDLIMGGIAAATVVLPGWSIARAARIPQPLAGGFVLGATALVNLVIVFDLLHVRLTLANLASAWAALAVGAAALAWKWARRPVAADATTSAEWRENWPLLLPLAPVALVVIYRAVAQPLFGIDTIFRWNYLAEQMIARGTLGFYPPVTAGDFEVYAWPDGIAPAVSALYFWAYALAGATRPVLTAPVVVLQFAIVVMMTQALARRWFSSRAAAFAGALLACSPLVAWATAMGQETGLMAIAFAGLLLYLPRNRTEENFPALVFAALAAGLGALAREYGLVLPVFGLALCAARRLSLRGGVIFGATAAAVIVPWYARNWVHTGNPLFGLPVDRWFQGNEVHRWMNESFLVEFGWSALPAEAPRLLLTNCLAGLAGMLIGARYGVRTAAALTVAIGISVALWAISIGYTAAGFIYSLRVLNPALVASAVLGGAALAHWIPGRRHFAAMVCGLTLFATDAALRALTLPANVYRVPLASWFSIGGAVQEYHNRPVYAELARIAGGQRMLVLGPNALLTQRGARTVPLWSPEVRFLFDGRLSPPVIARQLREAGIGFVLLNTGSANERFLARSRFFRDPEGTLRTVWSDGDMVLLRVNEAAKAAATF